MRRKDYEAGYQQAYLAGMNSTHKYPPATNLTLSERSDTVNGKSGTKRGNMKSKYTAAALLLVLILMLTLACSGDDPTPAQETDRSQQELLRTIDRMSQEIDSLKQGMEESKRTKDAEEASVQEDETPLTPATTPIPASTPELAEIPTPTGPGICGRSPEVQKAILESLKVSLCRVVTHGELFRITTLGVKMDTAKAGDFHGMVNVEVLGIEATNVEPQAFTGLESLKKFQLTIKDDGSIETGAVQGLQRLEEMTLTVAPNGSIETGAFQGLSNLETLQVSLGETPDFDGMPNLKHINIQWHETGIVSSTPFGNLPNLESAEISIGFRDDDEPKGKEFQIPGNMFENNTKVKKIQLSISAPDRMLVKATEGLFSNNPLLEEILIRSEQFLLPRDTFRHLKNLKQLNLQAYWTEDGWKKNKLALHESSPLYSVITIGGRQPSGYDIVEEDE